MVLTFTMLCLEGLPLGLLLNEQVLMHLDGGLQLRDLAVLLSQPGIVLSFLLIKSCHLVLKRGYFDRHHGVLVFGILILESIAALVGRILFHLNSIVYVKFVQILNLLVHAHFLIFMEATILIFGELEVCHLILKLVYAKLAILDIVLQHEKRRRLKLGQFLLCREQLILYSFIPVLFSDELSFSFVLVPVQLIDHLRQLIIRLRHTL